MYKTLVVELIALMYNGPAGQAITIGMVIAAGKTYEPALPVEAIEGSMNVAPFDNSIAARPVPVFNK